METEGSGHEDGGTQMGVATEPTCPPGPRGRPAGLSSAQVASLAARAGGAAFGAVTVLAPEGLRVDAAHGFDPAVPPPVAALCEHVLREGRLVAFGGENPPPIPAGAGGARVRLFVGAPIRTPDGESRGVLWIADEAPGPRPDPELEALLMCMADQWTLHTGLEELRLQYERTLNLVGEAAFRCAADGMLTWVSPSWETLSGRPVDATVEQPLTSLLHGDLGDVLSAVADGADPDRVSRVNCSLLAGDGIAIPVELAVTRFPRGDGRPAEVLGVVTDLRARQQRELEARHDQKLESLGRLSAGIAHEINTPIQFVGDNTRFLASAYQDMLGLLLTYRECMDATSGQLSWEERTARATEAECQADIDYLAAEVPLAVEQSLEGIERVASLVRAMKSFSYKDAGDRTYADLNEALTTTLTVARNEVKYVADVTLDLGELPPVLCHVGDLNQVFLNLLVNAADALQDKGQRGEIRISTRTEGTTVVITIADNGSGIPPELQQVIFEPFFTTKEVGKGTGQGLALARNVVMEKHGGTIEVSSVPGEGTEFRLRLPVDGKRSVAA
jgi:signal transduction histidine kinase